MGWLIVSGAAGAQVPAGPSTVGGQKFRDCDRCPEMVVVPAGRFTMGSPPDEPGRRDDEGPQREVRVDRPFAVSRYEIKRREYEAFLKDSKLPVSGQCVTDRRQQGHWVPDAETSFHDPGFTQTSDHPAACLSWNDATAYIAWLNKMTGGGYRLLTEAEWEYVARAGSVTAYPWGSDIAQGCSYMNGFDRTTIQTKGDLYQGEAVPFADCSDGYVNTAPVGSFRSNAFGVHDMIGNLGEWVEDCSTDSYRPESKPDCSRRMVRGGSWGTQPRQLRSAERIRYQPTDVDDSIGIRVAKSLP